ncbi:MAG: hypothetical protein PHG81_00820 [Aliarcobacter sp.]|nr:hypothetical protein [Aliarcobacter sp.]
MKKIVGFSAVFLVVIVAVILFWFQSKINEEITSKIDELNNNGFVVKHEQSTNYIKTTGKGDIEVINSDKVASYIFANIKNEEIKKAFETQYNTLDSNEKGMFFEGIKFDYDFVLENFNGKVNSNIYLTQLSKKTMYDLSLDVDNSSSKWLLDFLKNRNLQVNINEKKEYKIADIDTVIPNEFFMTIRGITGNEKNLTISSFKLSDADVSNTGFLLLDNLNVDYEINTNKESSKTTIKGIEFQNEQTTFNIRNLMINSNYEEVMGNINTQSEFSFDEVVSKAAGIETLNLKNSYLKVNLNNFPIKKLDEITQNLTDQNYEEYFKSFVQSGITLQSTGNASSYTIGSQKIFETLKFDLALALNKNVSLDNIKKVNDVLESEKLTIDLDKQTAENVKNMLNLQQNLDINFIDLSDDLKRFETVLKSDGLYVNDKKVLDESQLLFPNDEQVDDQVLEDTTPIQKIEQKNLKYTYKMIDENLLRLDIKYKSNLKVVSSGGISLSFPQLTDKTRIIKNSTNSFKEINLYNAGTEIWNGGLEQNVASSYLLVEGWDDNWDNSTEKDLSLVIDTNGLETLEVYIRAGALNEKDANQDASEIVPQAGELDQQNYPVEFLEIPLSRVR